MLHLTQVPQKEELDDDKEQLSPPGFHLVFLPFSGTMRVINQATI